MVDFKVSQVYQVGDLGFHCQVAVKCNTEVLDRQWNRCSWLSPGKATLISHGRNPIGTTQLLKKRRKKERKKDAQRTVIKSGKKKERSGLSTQRYNLVVI